MFKDLEPFKTWFPNDRIVGSRDAGKDRDASSIPGILASMRACGEGGEWVASMGFS